MQSQQLLESIPELEFYLRDWEELGSANTLQFSKYARQTINRIAWIMYLKNPLIKRGVEVTALYVWGRGMEILAPEEQIQETIDAFLNDRHNFSVITDHTARNDLETKLSVTGNLFFILFTHPVTGHVRVACIDEDEIQEVVKDPNTSKPLYYLRKFVTVEGGEVSWWYPDYEHKNPDPFFRRMPVRNERIYHVNTSIFDLGISEFYAAIDWAIAYKRFLEDFATLMASVAMFSWKMSTKGGKSAIAKAKSSLQSTIGINSIERNPPPAPGSVLIEDTDTVNWDLIKSSGSVTPASAGRELLLMVATVFGIPETFFANMGTSNLATAKALDRPTELKFTNRQQLWKTVYTSLIWYQIEQSVKAPAGILSNVGDVSFNEYNEEIVTFPDTVNSSVLVRFPPILERDIDALLRGFISAITLDGKQPLALQDPALRPFIELMLNQLGIDNAAELLEELDTFEGEADAIEHSFRRTIEKALSNTNGAGVEA